MKKYYIIGASVLLAGAIIFGAGFLLAGRNFGVLDSRSSQGGFETKEYVFEASGVSKISVDEKFGDVKLLPSDDRKIHIYGDENENYYYTVENKGGVISIVRSGSDKWIDRIVDFNIIGEEITLRICLPDGMKPAFEIEHDCGDITAEGMTLALTDVQTDLGDIEFTGVTADKLTAETDCGNVELKNVSGRSGVDAKTDSGDIDLERVSSDKAISGVTKCGDAEIKGGKAGSLELRSDTGKISAEDTDAGESALLSTDCGDVKVDSLSAKREISLSTELGDIRGTLCGAMRDYSIEADADCGESNLPDGLTGGKTDLSAYTACGDIKIEFESAK